MKRTSSFSNRAIGALSVMAMLLASCSQEKRISRSTEILKDKNTSAEKRRSAAQTLGEIGEPAIPALIEMMKPEYRHAFSDIGYAFGRMGPACIPSLIDALKHQESFVRYSSALLLASAGSLSARAAPSLQSLLENREEKLNVRWACVCALGEIGKAAQPAVPALLEATQEGNPQLYEQAVQSLKKIDRTALDLIPLQEKTTGGLIGKYKNFSQWDYRQIMVQIGRLEYARFDRDRNWKLTQQETSGTSIARYHPTWSKPFLTFEQSGNLAFDQFIVGYKTGYKKAHPELDGKSVDQGLEKYSTRKGLALMLRNSLRSCDRDRNGVLSDDEYAAWARKSKNRKTAIPMALTGTTQTLSVSP